MTARIRVIGVESYMYLGNNWMSEKDGFGETNN